MTVIVPLPKEMRITDKFSIKWQFLCVFAFLWQGILAQKWQDGRWMLEVGGWKD